MVDVFISYSRHDKEKVARLAQKIEAEGYDVWWDAELPPHKSYGDVITEKIGSAKAAVVVWSPTAAQSEWVRAEADVARNQKKLIQTALGDIMPPLPFNQIQFADIGDWQGEDDHRGWRKVLASLTELCGDKSAAAAAGAGAVAKPEPPPPPPPPPAAPEPAASSKWPLYAGIGVAVIALVIAAAFILGTMSGSSVEESEALAAAAGEQTIGGASAEGGDGSSTTNADEFDADVINASEALRAGLPREMGSAHFMCQRTLSIVGENCGCMVNRATDAGIADSTQARMFGGDGSRATQDEADRFTRIVRACSGYNITVRNAGAALRAEAEEPPVESAAPRISASDEVRGRRVGCYFRNSVYEYDGACDFIAQSGGDFITRSLSGPYFDGVDQIGLDVTGSGVGLIELFYRDGTVEQISVRRSAEDRACWQGNQVIFCAR